MKKIIVITICIIFLFQAHSQTYYPSCYSNAHGWRITKIESTISGTYVSMSFYTDKSDYEFWINSGMYIEKRNDSYSKKYYILSFLDNQLNTTYKLNPLTEYNFTFKFEKIPDSWKDINIAEPVVKGYNCWYWNYISLNKPSTERLKLDNFLLFIEFISTYA